MVYIGSSYFFIVYIVLERENMGLMFWCSELGSCKCLVMICLGLIMGVCKFEVCINLVRESGGGVE